jgi:hypothetical protein
MPSITVTADFSKFGTFAKSLDKAAATGFRAAIRMAVNEVGKDALDRAKNEASSFSTKIPENIKLKTSFGARSAGVTIATDLKKVPYARLYERGSKGSGGKYIRHPVYGSQDENARNDVRARYDNKSTWRNIPSHPFFYKSVWGEKDELKNKIIEEVGDVLASLGYV